MYKLYNFYYIFQYNFSPISIRNMFLRKKVELNEKLVFFFMSKNGNNTASVQYTKPTLH
jgi:hypothetical protein